jgi:tetratricopeptide (TPR) repeat protein
LKEPSPAYQGDGPFIFVSYSHADEKIVYEEIRRLQDQGVNVWYDSRIRAGSEWSDALADAISGCSCFLYFITPNSVVSENCRRELNHAIAESRSILAVYLQETDVPGGIRLNLNNRQAILRYELSRKDYEYRLAGALDVKTGARESQAIESTTSSRPDTKQRSSSRGYFYGVALGSAACAIVAAAYWSYMTLIADGDQTEQRIAVEAFTYPSGNGRLEEYGSLFRSELINQLSLVSPGQFKVVGLADEADILAQGRLSDLSENTRLFFQIFRRDEGRILWSKSIDLPPEPTVDVLSTRPQQLAAVVQSVASLWSVSSDLTDSSGAIEEYIAGFLESRLIWLGLGGDWNAAVSHDKRAVELDPNFILPLMDLSNIYANRFGRRLRYQDAVGPAHEYIRKVLAIDENATGQLGWINTILDLDYEAARANLEYARDQRPIANMEFNLALLLLLEGNLEEAIERYQTAIRLGLGTNNAAANVQLTLAYFAAGRYEEAAMAATQAELQAAGTGLYAYIPALGLKVSTLHYSGERDSARVALESAWSTYGKQYPDRLVSALALVGENEKAEVVLDELEARWTRGEAVSAGSCFFARLYLNDLDRAFVWMNRAIDDREIGYLPLLKRSPILDPIRNDPRFIDAMSRLAEIETQGTPIRSVAYP